MEGNEGGHQPEYYKGSRTDSRILGDDAFIDQMLGSKQLTTRSRVTLEGILKEVCRQNSVKANEWKDARKDQRLSEDRGLAAWLVLETGVGTLAELGRVTGRDITTLSSAAKRLQRRAQKDLDLDKRMKEVLQMFS